MYQIVRQFILFMITSAGILGWLMPVHASIDYYTCQHESDTVFGERLEFGYDNLRNTVLIQEHKNGAYNPNFTLGNVILEGGALGFDFEYWENGSVVIRDSHSLNFENMILDSAQYFYSNHGETVEAGQTAIASCGLVTDTDEAVGGTKSNSSPRVKTEQPAPIKEVDTASLESKVVCYTKENSAEGPKSSTYCLKSQLPPQKEYTYGPENLAQADGAWCEGETGQGIGVGVELSFQSYSNDGPPPEYDRLLISNGYDKTTQTFMENSRVKQIEIKSDDAFGGQTWVRTLRDEKGVQEVHLGGKISPNGILITILDVYPGQKYEDTCLSFMSADFGF
jgi:hypothetical protein